MESIDKMFYENDQLTTNKNECFINILRKKIEIVTLEKKLNSLKSINHIKKYTDILNTKKVEYYNLENEFNKMEKDIDTHNIELRRKLKETYDINKSK